MNNRKGVEIQHVEKSQTHNLDIGIRFLQQIIKANSVMLGVAATWLAKDHHGALVRIECVLQLLDQIMAQVKVYDDFVLDQRLDYLEDFQEIKTILSSTKQHLSINYGTP